MPCQPTRRTGNDVPLSLTQLIRSNTAAIKSSRPSPRPDSLHVRDLAVREGDFQILVHVDFLRSQIDDLLRLA